MDGIEELRAAEERRCSALMEGDAVALEAMLAEDLVHVHLPGRVDSKAGYLEGFRGKYLFRNVKRGPLNIRIYGQVGVMVGELTQKIVVKDSGEVHDIRAITTQTWLKDGGRWLLTTCHNAPLTA